MCQLKPGKAITETERMLAALGLSSLQNCKPRNNMLTTELAINTLVLPQYTEALSDLFPVGSAAVCPVTTFWSISKMTERDALSSSITAVLPANGALKRRYCKTCKSRASNCPYTDTWPLRGVCTYNKSGGGDGWDILFLAIRETMQQHRFCHMVTSRKAAQCV